MTHNIKAILGAFLASVSFVATAQATEKIVLYTDRPTARLQPAADKFFAETGVQVEIVEKAYPQILAQLNAEGAATPADLVMTKDLVYLSELAQMGWLKSYESSLIDGKVIPTMKHPANLWAPTSFRARTIVYNPNKVNPSELSTYEDLADAKWAGRLCLRTSNHGYNEGLVADLVVRHGFDKTKEIVDGWVQNLAIDPIKGDTPLLEQIASGACDVGIANHYYLAQLVAQNPNFPVKVFYADQNNGGVHTNGTGVGLISTTKNTELATKFMETLLDDQINLDISTGHFDFPAIKYLAPNTLIKDWGRFTISGNNWFTIGQQVPAAREIFKQTGYK